MDRAQCPTCSRWLHLPEQARGQRVQCPLCQQVFVAPSLPQSPPLPLARAVPNPTEPWRPAESSPAEQRRRDSLSRLPARTPVSQRLALLANWIFGLALMSFLWNATCGCGGLLALGDLIPEAHDLIIFLGFLLYFLPLIIYLIVLFTSHTLYGAKRNRNVFLFGLALLQLEYLFGTVRLTLIVRALPQAGSSVWNYLNAISLGLSIGLLITSTMAWRQIRRESSQAESKGNDTEDD
ncbi:MAG: hypothetical protein SNJ75_14565 [Gemmataceae bacterium]